MKTKAFLCVIVLMVGLLASNVFAKHDWENKVGYWSQTALWTGDGYPDGTSDVKIFGSSAVCSLNSDEGFWELSDRYADIYDGATLVIGNGGTLKPARVQIGTTTPGHVIQTGGLLKIYRDKFYVGRTCSGSTYTISGGTLTHFESDGYILIGYEGGEGTFTVDGTGAMIQMRKIFIGAGSDGAASAGTGTLEYKISSAGVSPLRVSDSWWIDYGGAAGTANLVLSLTGAPPAGDILLIEDQNGGDNPGIFDTVNGVAAPEGTEVVLSFGGTDYTYTLTYMGNYNNDDEDNDLMLLSSSGPPVYICTNPIASDLNGDCQVDFTDFAIFASDWLVCNRDPEESCWQ